MQIKTVYKLVTSAEWDAARAEGVYRGSALDRQDGYIHLSTATQVAGTARKHFSGVPDLVLLAVDVAMLDGLHGADRGNLAGEKSDPSPLRWEVSRGGELFPHLYAQLPASAVRSAIPAPLSDDGTPILPSDLSS